MEQIPSLVQEIALNRTTNAVCVALVKFTLDQMAVYFTQETPAPAKLARQIVSLRAAYDVMNDAYAEQMKRAETAGIKARDDEGDQLVYGVKGILEGAIRMTYDQERLALANQLWEAYRKYRIDPTENMISEWSKVQQFCEEYLAKSELQAAGAALSLDGPIRRLAVIADEIRDLMTERNAATPEQGAMANAREAVYPEYRTAILLLNAFTAVSDDANENKALIRALNDNINYVRKHAMAQGSGQAGSSSSLGSGGDNGGTGTAENGSGSGSEGGGSGESGSGSQEGGSGSGSGSEQGGSGSGSGSQQEPTSYHLTMASTGSGSYTVKDESEQVITGAHDFAAGTALTVEITPAEGQTPTATINSQAITLTENDGTYSGSFEMPAQNSLLQISTGTASGGNDGGEGLDQD